MKKIVLLLLVCIPFMAFSQTKKQMKKANEMTNTWMYDVEMGKISPTQGSKVVKIWSVAPSADAAIKQAPKNAVHAVIFKGVPRDRYGVGVVALDNTSKADIEHAAFFENFFADGGKYMQFVTLVNNGNIAAGDLMKIDKKNYKVGVLVTVRYDALRKYLESEGVIRSLSSGF